MKVEFEDWFDLYNNEIDGFLDYYIMEKELNFNFVKEMMKLAWEARYSTLTYHDL